jgi:hypothetical protein
MLVNGEKQGPYDALRRSTFSSDGLHVVFPAKVGQAYFVVVDGIEGKHYEAMLTPDNGIVFDSASSFYYLAARSDKIYLVEHRL